MCLDVQVFTGVRKPRDVWPLLLKHLNREVMMESICSLFLSGRTTVPVFHVDIFGVVADFSEESWFGVWDSSSTADVINQKYTLLNELEAWR